MMPRQINLIQYNTENKVYVGGYKNDSARSFVCGFVDKKGAFEAYKKLMASSQFKVSYNRQNDEYQLQSIKPSSKLLPKPLRRHKLQIVTMDTMLAAFFVKVNNTDLILIDDVSVKENGIVSMKTSYELEMKIDESLIVEQISDRYKNEYFKRTKSDDDGVAFV